MTDNTLEATISCLCGEHQHTFALPASTTDLGTYICHCNSCRKASGGSLYQGATIWNYTFLRASETTETPSDPKTLLQLYKFGPILDYWYCTTCSTKMYWQYKRPGSVTELFPGLIPETVLTDGGVIVSCILQVHIADTLDEGLSSAFLAADESLAPRHQNHSDSVMYVAQDVLRPAGDLSKPIEGKCHCGRTQVKLLSSSGHKFPVEIDTSRESRLLNSVDMSVWAIVNPEDIQSINNKPLDSLETLHLDTKDENEGSISTYTTDKTIVYFCNGCSATILTRPLEAAEHSSLKVGAGLLDSTRGARADDFLDWSKVQTVEKADCNIRLDPQNLD